MTAPQPTAELREMAQNALRLASKATKGPWHAGDEDFPTTLNNGVRQDLLTGITWNEGEIVEGYTQGMFNRVEDAQLVAKSRDLVPDLATALLASLDREAAKDTELLELKENNFHWDRLEETNVCGFCGSQNQRTGGIKAHIRRIHIEG